MTITFAFYADAGLTIALSPVALSQVQSGAPTDVVVYYGSNTAGRQIQNATAPGVDALQLAIYDAASGSGLPTSAITLGLSAGELDTNTPGAPLDLGVTLLSGVAGAVAVFLRLDVGAASVGGYSDLQFEINGLESDQ